MILEPKSKPVKFRIRSGGEEHSSLESLRRDFVWTDIKPLCGTGKQLEKWLDRIDADAAKKYKKIKNPGENVLSVYNVLLGKERLDTNADVFNKYESIFQSSSVGSLSEVAELRGLNRLCREIVSELTVNEITKYARCYKSLYEVFEVEAILRVQREQDKIQPADIFALGEMVFDSGRNPGLAEEWIRYASSKGLKKAMDFIDEKFEEPRDSVRQRVFSLLSNEKLRRKLKESWEENEEIKNWSGFNKEEKRILSLSDTCMRIFQCHRGSWITDRARKEMYLIAENQFMSVKSDDILYEEKMFVWSMADYDEDRAKNRLERIACYPPAKSLLSARDNAFVAGSRKYKVGDPFWNSTNFDFWILNLDRFSQTERFQEMVSSSNSCQDDLANLFANSTVINTLNHSWAFKEYIYPSVQLTLRSQIFKFSDKCLEIFKLLHNGTVIGDIKLTEEIDRIMNERLVDTDPLYMEKVFVMGLFAKTFDLARQQMKKIENSYAAAFRLANDESHTLSIDGHVYSICDGWRRKNANELEYFIKHLPKFRKNVRFYK